MKNFLALLFAFGFISNSAIHGLVYNDPENDAIIIDDDAEMDPDIFDPAESDSTTTLPIGYCTTSGGFAGKCISFDSCYPYAQYLVGGDPDITTGLQEIFNATGPCPEGKDLVCCPDFAYGLPNKRPSILPQFTRPPGSGPPSTTEGTTTTTTTPPSETKAGCGIARFALSNDTSPKVVGGRIAAKGEFPWAVAILNNGQQFCGGSLFKNDFILTAAHCVAGMRSTGGIRIHLGSNEVSSPRETRGVSKILYNKDFSMQHLRNDIALMKLSSPVTFSSTIQPVCLNTDPIPYDKKAELAGWGKTSNHGYPSSSLRTVKMRVIPQAECRQQYQGTSAPQITSSMICAGERQAGHLKDACNGDSGGPLTYKEDDGPTKQIGVVSWGIGCGEKPGVYTSVKDYLSWINRNAK